MNRVAVITREQAENKDPKGELKQIYSKVEQLVGYVDDISINAANSPEVARGLSHWQQCCSHMSLSTNLKLKIEILVSELSGSQYCLDTYSHIGKNNAGLTDDVIANVRKGISDDPKTDTILKFTKKFVENNANVSEEDIKKLKDQGLTDQEIVEVWGVIMSAIHANWYDRAFKVGQ